MSHINNSSSSATYKLLINSPLNRYQWWTVVDKMRKSVLVLQEGNGIIKFWFWMSLSKPRNGWIDGALSPNEDVDFLCILSTGL